MSEYNDRILSFANVILEMPENNRITTLCSLLKCYDELVKVHLQNVQWDKNKPFWEHNFIGGSKSGD